MNPQTMMLIDYLRAEAKRLREEAERMEFFLKEAERLGALEYRQLVKDGTIKF